MIRRSVCVLLAVLALWPGSGFAYTWPRDDTGVPAPATSTPAPTTAVPALVTPTNPLPVVGYSPTATGPGANWFRSTGAAVGSTSLGHAAVNVGGQTLVGLEGGTNLTLDVSLDGGRNWLTYATYSTPFANGGSLALSAFGGVLVQTSKGFLIGSACSVGGGGGSCAPFGTLDQGLLAVTLATMTGVSLGANTGITVRAIGQQGTTLLAPVVRSDNTNALICTAATTQSTPGNAWTCTDLTTTFGSSNVPGGPGASGQAQVLATPKASTWLLVLIQGNNGARSIWRSTDNGVTWASAFTFTSSPATNLSAVLCLTASICLATDGSSIARSTNSGATWTKIASGTNLNGFLNWGGSIGVQVTIDPNNATGITFYSTDLGVTWTPGSQPSGLAISGLPGTTPLMNLVQSGSTAYMGLTSGCTGCAANVYTTTPTGTATITGADGTTAMGTAGSPGSAVVSIQGVASGTTVPISGSVSLTGAVSANQGNPQAIPFSGWPVLWSESTATSGATNHTSTTGAANTAVTVTLTQATNVAWRIERVDAFCSAGTATLTVTDGGTTIWTSPTAGVGTALFTVQWIPGLQTAGASPAVSLSACGAGNTGTVNLQAVRW